MNEHRPLRLSLLLVDSLRLAVIVASLAFLRPILNATSIASLGGFSLAVAVPQAFFLLIPLFLWLDVERYGAYVPLYVAGKATSAATFVAWLIAAVPTSWVVLELGDVRGLALCFIALIIAIWDTASALLAGLTLAKEAH